MTMAATNKFGSTKPRKGRSLFFGLTEPFSSFAQYKFCEVPGRSFELNVGVCYTSSMSKLLEDAIEQLRELPEDQQDAAADVVFAYISNEERHYVLRPEQIAEVRRTRDGLRTSKTRLASPEEVVAVRYQQVDL